MPFHQLKNYHSRAGGRYPVHTRCSKKLLESTITQTIFNAANNIYSLKYIMPKSMSQSITQSVLVLGNTL